MAFLFKIKDYIYIFFSSMKNKNRIFQEHKEIKSKWIFATNLETEAEMLSNSQVRYHARKIIDVISRIVDKAIHTPNIQELSIDEFNLIKLGRSHFHYGVRREHFVVKLIKLNLIDFYLILAKIT